MDLGPLEADFVTLGEDLARIEGAHHSLGKAAVSALDQIIREGTKDGDPAESGLAGRFQAAMYAILRDSAVSDLDGNMNFAVDGPAVMQHAAPVMHEVVTVVQGQVQSLLDGLTVHMATGAAQLGAAATAAPEPTPAAPSAEAPEDDRPTVRLKVDLTSLFAGFIQSAAAQALTQAATPKKKG